MADRTFRFGPTALTTSIANVLNGTVTSWAGPVGILPAMAGVYLNLRHVRIVNKTAGAVSFSMHLGATGAEAAGTEVIGSLLSVAAYSAFDWYGLMPMVAADFLTAKASANTSLTVEGEGAIAVI
jgi:hypothetical protein